MARKWQDTSTASMGGSEPLFQDGPVHGVPFEPSSARLGDIAFCQQELKLNLEAFLRHLQSIVPGFAFSIACDLPCAPGEGSQATNACPDWAPAGSGKRIQPWKCETRQRENWERSRSDPPGGLRGRYGRRIIAVRLRVASAEVGRLTLQLSPHWPASERGWAHLDLVVHILGMLEDQAGTKLVNRRLQEELESARRQVHCLSAEIVRLRHELHARLPEVPEEPVRLGAAGTRPRTIDRMLAYVRDHYRKPMSLDQLAQALGRNASYLSTVFSSATGVTFHAYVDELRLCRAKEMLRDTAQTIAQVAVEAGYASEDWFRHAFKAHTGLSPSAWRASQA